MTIRLRESILTPVSGRGSSFFSGAVRLLNPYVVAPVAVALPLTPIHPVVISPLSVEAAPVSLPLNEASISYYFSVGATESLAITTINPTVFYLGKQLHQAVYGTQAFKKHQLFYDSNEVYNLHETSWSLLSSTLHQATYASILNTESSRLHESIYASLGGSSAVFAQHDSLYLSLGGSTQVFAEHITSWASTGANAAYQLHEVEYESFTQQVAAQLHEALYSSLGGATQAYRLHDATYLSLGGATTAYRLHDSFYLSLGGASQVFSLHETSWASVPDIRQLHTVTWKSVVAAQRLHKTGWKSDHDIYRIHESRYRSLNTTPILQDGLIYVRV